MADTSRLDYLEIQHLKIQSQEKTILDIPKASIPIETITAIIGPNGSGKTTLLKAIAGLIKPDQGSILSPFSSTFMVIHQASVFKMSVFNNLSLLRDVHPQIDKTKVEEAIEKFDLSDLKEQSATLLSSGERQRLALTRAYLMQAKFVLLDEPTASIDPNATQMIEKNIKEMAKEGIKFLLVSHDLRQIKTMSQHIVLMQNQMIQEVILTQEFLKSPHHFVNPNYIQW